MPSTTLVASALALLHPVFAAYTLQDHYTATNWLTSFSFQAIPDPTQGYVSYLDSATAQKTGLFKTLPDGKVYMGVDSASPAPPPGRPSLRMQSLKAYTHALVILDLAHMPASTCGTWPAFWTTKTETWPIDGEIDIIEGVNSQRSNFMTLHTGGPACDISGDPSNYAEASKVIHTGCDLNSPGQAKGVGCSVNNTLPASYGTGFNANGGGIYAMEWTSAHISIWHFPRTSAPADIAAASPDPTKWPRPAARFQGPCNIDNSFRNHNIIFDTTFCGVWAGDADWTTSGCAAAHGGSCSAYVRDHPEDFKESYWEVNDLRVYQNDGKASAPAAPAAPLVSPAPPAAPAVPAIPAVPAVPAPAPAPAAPSAPDAASTPAAVLETPAAPIPTAKTVTVTAAVVTHTVFTHMI